MKTLFIFISMLLFFNHSFSKQYTIYLSADMSIAKESGESILDGINVALQEINYTINSDSLTIKVLDHRGSTPRFRSHLEAFENDPTALVLYSGLHSPPLLSTRDEISKKGFVVLVPWAAAGPITRFPQKENSIFRLSIDDSKAGIFITNDAIKNDSFKKPYLLLESTGWGKSNKKTFSKTLKKHGIIPQGIKQFSWGIGNNEAKNILRDIHSSGADIIFFVGNAPEGKVFAKAMASLPKEKRIPIRSHWGITGGNFAEVLNSDMRDSIELLFIQSNFSFLQNPLSELGKKVLKQAIMVSGGTIDDAKDITAPTGFIHSYDLTKILIAALQSVKPGKTAKEYGVLIKKELEILNKPVQGLVKTYQSPFAKWNSDNPDAHEALGLEDWTMARFDTDNSIILLK